MEIESINVYMAEQKIEQKLVIKASPARPGSFVLHFDIAAAAGQLTIYITTVTIYAPAPQDCSNPFKQIQLHSGSEVVNTSHFRHPAKQQLLGQHIAVDPYLYGCNSENSLPLAPEARACFFLELIDPAMVDAASIRIVIRYTLIHIAEPLFVWQEYQMGLGTTEYKQAHKIICDVDAKHPIKNVMLETQKVPISTLLYSSKICQRNNTCTYGNKEIIWSQLDYAGASKCYYHHLTTVAAATFTLVLIFHNLSDIPTYETPQLVYHRFTPVIKKEDGTLSSAQVFASDDCVGQ